MPKLYGRNYTKEELLRRVGDISQVGGVRLGELGDGNERGARIADFRTGTGFNFTVLLDRGLDISYAEDCGRPLCWRSETGDVAPSFFEPEGLSWLRTFYGGLVVTCGLTYAGAPCTDEGKTLGLHGRISHIPAKNVLTDGEWQGNDYVMWVQGKLRENIVFGENIQMTRKIWAVLGEKKIYLTDVVENLGYEEQPLMILYHINGGFPAIDEDACLVSPTVKYAPRDEVAKTGLEEYYRFQTPTHDFKERVYYHEMKPDSDGYVWAALINKKCEGGFGFYIKYLKSQLDQFIEWKMNAEGTYVVGMEPANCRVEGRDKDRANGVLKFIKPGEKKEFSLEIAPLSSKAEVDELEEKVRAIKGK